MIWSYSAFKREVVPEKDAEDECAGCCDEVENDEVITEYLETVATDILEAEEIRFTNVQKQASDSIYGSHASLQYSREVPTKSMEILGVPFNKKKNGEDFRWLRFELVQLQEGLKINVLSSDPS